MQSLQQAPCPATEMQSVLELGPAWCGWRTLSFPRHGVSDRKVLSKEMAWHKQGDPDQVWMRHCHGKWQVTDTQIDFLPLLRPRDSLYQASVRKSICACWPLHILFCSLSVRFHLSEGQWLAEVQLVLTESNPLKPFPPCSPHMQIHFKRS